VPTEYIVVKGAREHNLKNIDVSIPRDKLVVITGVSGSGKSTLAFDTIYAEGQRRYVESLSSYARQFLGRMDKPDVDYIEGLSPAISIDQKGTSHNPRSTVGTVTEVYDYLRLLFARTGRPHCPNCGIAVARQTVQQIIDAVLMLPEGTRVMVMAPKVIHRKGEHRDVLEAARKSGFVRVRVDTRIHDLSDNLTLNKNKWHTIDIIVDRLIIDQNLEKSRVADSVETALKQGGGVVKVINTDNNQELLFSEHFACTNCGISLGEIEPRTFSFNSPHGACPTCTGLGLRLEIDPELVIPNKDISIAEGAIMPWTRAGASSPWYSSLLESMARASGFSTHSPIRELTNDDIQLILFGNGGHPITMSHRSHSGRIFSWQTDFEGVIPNLERRFRETTSDYIRHETERYMSSHPCPSCKGMRLRPESLSVDILGLNIMEVCALPISQTIEWVRSVSEPKSHEQHPEALTQRELTIGSQILKEIEGRLRFLHDIGLDYLSLNRTASTLSGGEAQRIRLATQIGSGLMGVLYVCDEPTVGLHPADDKRLIDTLKRLRDLGNTVIVVEHDEAVMRAADHIIDLGPGAGEHGGWIVAAGSISDVANCTDSITGQYLSGRKTISFPASRRLGNGNSLVIRGAKENNLKNIDVKLPLGMLVCITGVSGSGKSTLIYEVLYKKLAQILYKSKDRPGACDLVSGLEHIDKVVNIDQSPIGRTPRSNPATYVGVFTHIRELFASVPEARARGYTPGRFSFNVKGGRCESCAGGGYIQIEMHFLPDVTVPCDICYGKRYNREALEISFKETTIAQVLEMTVDQALEFFWHFPRVRSKLETLRDVGLGYLHLGQPATTLSGGEAQRVKLATELSRRATGKTLYILDEPTTGLSFEDAAALLRVLHRLVDAGNSVVLIEHHLDLIKNGDWIIDLGPGAGEKGGYVVAEGTPEHIAAQESSYTGHYLDAIISHHLLRKHPSRVKNKATL
jgi:excinuclease ABC subunit A